MQTSIYKIKKIRMDSGHFLFVVVVFRAHLFFHSYYILFFLFLFILLLAHKYIS
jgi:hypothetical protein